jgi:acyl-CoA synthetase (AMP-forming)/AMP-acid ligase II
VEHERHACDSRSDDAQADHRSPRTRRTNLSTLTNLSYGGAQIPLPVIRRAIERLPKTIGFVSAYGQTETTSTLTTRPDDHRLTGPREEVEKKVRRLASIGKLPTSSSASSTTTANRCPPARSARSSSAPPGS